MDNTNLLQKINSIGNELSFDSIDKLKNLYYTLKFKSFDFEDQEKRNASLFLLDEMRYTLFDMLRKANNISNNESVRKMVYLLDLPGIKVDDLISINNHVFIVGESIRDFSRKKYSYLVNDYLKEISNISFEECTTETLTSYKISVINKILDALNDYLNSLNSGEKSVMPYMYMEDNKVYYNTPNLHIYSDTSLLDICYMIMFGKKGNVELMIEENAQNFYLINVKIMNNSLSFEEKENDLWTLQNFLKNSKSLKKEK